MLLRQSGFQVKTLQEDLDHETRGQRLWWNRLTLKVPARFLFWKQVSVTCYLLPASSLWSKNSEKLTSSVPFKTHLELFSSFTCHLNKTCNLLFLLLIFFTRPVQVHYMQNNQIKMERISRKNLKYRFLDKMSLTLCYILRSMAWDVAGLLTIVFATKNGNLLLGAKDSGKADTASLMTT